MDVPEWDVGGGETLYSSLFAPKSLRRLADDKGNSDFGDSMPVCDESGPSRRKRKKKSKSKTKDQATSASIQPRAMRTDSEEESDAEQQRAAFVSKPVRTPFLGNKSSVPPPNLKRPVGNGEEGGDVPKRARVPIKHEEVQFSRLSLHTPATSAPMAKINSSTNRAASSAASLETPFAKGRRPSAVERLQGARFRMLNEKVRRRSLPFLFFYFKQRKIAHSLICLRVRIFVYGYGYVWIRV